MYFPFCDTFKQEAYGLHCSQFNSINTYDYIIMLIKRRKNTLCTLLN